MRNFEPWMAFLQAVNGEERAANMPLRWPWQGSHPIETVHVGEKPLRRTHNRLDLVLPFISLRCPSFHHVHLPRVRTPQCSLCQAACTCVCLLSILSCLSAVNSAAIHLRCTPPMAGTVNLESMEVEVPVCRFQRELERVCVPLLSDRTGWKIANGRTISNRKCWSDFLFVVLEKQQKTTNKLKICTKKWLFLRSSLYTQVYMYIVA